MDATPSTTAASATEGPPTRLIELAGAFLKLGCTSFGGPVAHLGYLHAECVRRRRWMSEEHYSDTVALCQFLPGPASSQLVYALGMHRRGLAGALLASFCFTLPSAILMILFGYGIAIQSDLREAGWLHGLKLAAVAVVAQAAWGMGRKLCPDRARISLAMGAAGTLLVMPGALAQVGVILAGALAGWWLYRGEAVPDTTHTRGWARHHLWAAGVLACWAALLVGLPVLAVASSQREVGLFDAFYRAGSLVFGGGHVVLPLLRAEVVPPGWIGDDAFLAGYGAAQAVPGPLFTFSAYLGTVIVGGPHAWAGGVLCLFAIFLPAWMLIGGALPFWHELRRRAWAQAALRGANAAVVGVLLAALYHPVWTEAVTGARDVAAVLALFALLEVWRLPPWLVVLASAFAGQWLL